MHLRRSRQVPRRAKRGAFAKRKSQEGAPSRRRRCPSRGAVSPKPPREWIGNGMCAEGAKRDERNSAHRVGRDGFTNESPASYNPFSAVSPKPPQMDCKRHARERSRSGKKENAPSAAVARVREKRGGFRARARIWGGKTRGGAKREVDFARVRGKWVEKRAGARMVYQ